MSNRSLLEFNHDYCPSEAARDEWSRQLVSYLTSGDARHLPQGVTRKHMRHHSEPCPLVEPARRQVLVVVPDARQAAAAEHKAPPGVIYRWPGAATMGHRFDVILVHPEVAAPPWEEGTAQREARLGWLDTLRTRLAPGGLAFVAEPSALGVEPAQPASPS